jgi:hypothetical protein
VLACIVLVAIGCSHYKVTDPTSGQTWYTEHVEQKGGGVVEFKDGASGEPKVAISPKIEKISKDEYEKGIGKKKS